MAKPSADNATFEQELVALIPQLRAFGQWLCGDPVHGDDLAQEALARALAFRHAYTPGTNMRAWTFMILRNQFYTEKRRSWRTCELDPEVAARTLKVASNPTATLELDEMRRALNMLAPDHREALILVAAGGLSYEEVSQITGAAVGTVKSRVSRARDRLALIFAEGAIATDDCPPHHAMAAIFQQIEGYRPTHHG
jgi:RNA polymerase sigma-70 factor (ECF subfamily)